MRRALFALFLLLLGALAPALRAQTTAWLQIEAQPNLSQAEERARAYAGAFGNVSGFRLGSGWYAIALGPYSPEDAAAELARMKSDRLIPGDSYVTDGTTYGQRFWPVGAGALATAEPTPAAEPPATEPPAQPVPALAQTDPAPGALLPDETPAEARRAEAALSGNERQLIQTALAWYGFYGAAIDGAFGPGTRSAMADWQGAQGYEPTGVLTTAQRATLIDGYQAQLAELGLAVVRDEEAGIEIEMPTTMVAFGRYDPPFAQYDEKDGSGVRVILISEPGDRARLSGLYDLMQTLSIVPMNGERSLGDRGFDITGRNAEISSYSHAELSGGLIKGFTLVWRTADSEKMSRVVEAMKSSFKPFGTRALDPSLVPLTDEQRSDMLSGLKVRLPAMTRTGFFIDAAGHVLTTPEVVAGCKRVTIGDDAEADVTLNDAALGIAVLTPRSPLAPPDYARFSAASPRLQSEVAVAGYSYGHVLDEPVLTFGALEDVQGLDGEPEIWRLSLDVRQGDAGGPVLDSTGAVLGMLLPRTTDAARQLPETVQFAADADALRSRLAAAGIALTDSSAAGALAPEDLTKLALRMTVRVGCWN